MEKINKAVIVCAGLGTRFLPFSKAVPKEMLPVVDTPVIAHILNEAVEAGASEILIVLSRGKEAIIDYFSPSSRIEEQLLRQGNAQLLQILRQTRPNADIRFTYQESARGSGDALMCAASFTGEQPFFVCFGDDLFCFQTPPLVQLANAYQKNCAAAAVGLKYVKGSEISKYGSAKILQSLDESTFICSGFLEKMPIERAPSQYGIVGRYIFNGEIYNELSNTAYVGRELRLTDAINTLCTKNKVIGRAIEGARYDCGDKLGAIKAGIEFGLSYEFSAQLKQYLTDLVKTF